MGKGTGKEFWDAAEKVFEERKLVWNAVGGQVAFVLVMRCPFAFSHKAPIRWRFVRLRRRTLNSCLVACILATPRHISNFTYEPATAFR